MKLNSESLLSVPAEKGECPHPQSVERLECDPVKVSEIFQKATCRKPMPTPLIKPKTCDVVANSIFFRQYASVYATRLWASRPVLEQRIKEEWQQGKKVEVKKINGLCESSTGFRKGKSPKDWKRGNHSQKTSDHEQHIAMREDVVVIIIGTIFKQQPEKPSILQELVEDNPMVPSLPKTNYTSDKDKLILEDETARVHLVPSKGCGMSVNSVVNGVICAVKGKPTILGRFEVDDVLWATPKPCVWPAKRESDVEMIFVSGLHIGPDEKIMPHLELLFDYLQGLSGSPDEIGECVKSKVRLFILGNSFHDVCNSTSVKEAVRNATRTQVAKKLDNILEQLSQTMEIYIIPGETDPAEPMFPQAPIHRCILPKASRRGSFHSLSNPTRLEIPIKIKKDSKETSPYLDIIVNSGQSISDAMKNTNISDPVEMAHTMLKWGHLCPTAPDTLALHPGISEDIFVLHSLPNIFITGGFTNFGMREWKDTLIVTVPEFSSTGVALILDKEMNFVPLNIKLVP